MARIRPWTATLAALVVATFAPAALAEGPTREPLPSDPLEFPAGLVCPFPVLIEAATNKQTITTFPSGRVMITGAFRGRVTNLASGESLELNMPGPAVLTTNEDGTISLKATGRTLFFFFPGDLGSGQPGALLSLSGHVEEVLTGDFSAVISFDHVGTSENLCETLA
jgi:hypothetical protein